MILKVRRFLADRLLVRSGLRDYLATRLLPDDYQVTKHLIRRLEQNGLRARDGLASMVFSASDTSAPSASLLDLSCRAIQRAVSLNMEDCFRRLDGGSEHIRHARNWPGEHYQLLGALVDLIKPRLVVEIGTAEGASSLAMKPFLHADGRLITFDLIPWRDYRGVRLAEQDFADGRLEQRIEDLSDPTVFARNADLIRQAEVIFIDAAKDGRLERILLRHFETVRFAAPPLFIFDDIRVWNMLQVWREIDRPKLDLTSFGHWSGTGLVEWVSR
jgi:predicted O-methyltransferase YrrM